MRPRFRVEAPTAFEEERDYVLSVLLNDWLGCDYDLLPLDGISETRLRLQGDLDGPVVVLPEVLMSGETMWLSEASLPEAPLPRVEPPSWSGMTDQIPVLFGPSRDHAPVLDSDGQRHVLGLDILGSLLFMLTRYEEYVRRDDLDDHGRFRGRTALLAHEGWLRWPVADMYVALFAQVLQRSWPGITLTEPSVERLRLSHDVDHPASAMLWRGPSRLVVLAGDLLHRRDARLASNRLQAFRTRGLSPRDPLNTFGYLMDESEAAGANSTFYFLTAESSVPTGSEYAISDPWVRPLLASICARGHKIGLHGSYGGYRDGERFREEWSRLVAACAGDCASSLRPAARQHYLRWEPPTTWLAQREAGIEFDESLGFADEVGYRAGTARSFEAFDLVNRRAVGIRVQPLHVMDVTLLQHMDMPAEESLDIVASMGDRTKRYGGALSILWHNSSLQTEHDRALYHSLVSDLA